MGKKRGPYSSPLQQLRQQRILAVTRDELERGGVAALTMKAVAQASDVSLKTLYNIFGNRDQLLLKVASELLDELMQRTLEIEAEPGIPQLLAFSEGAMRLFADAPDHAAATIRILLRAENDHESAYEQLTMVHGLALSALRQAAKQGEFNGEPDLEELANLVSAHQWGLALMWDKGLLPLEQLLTQVSLSHCLTLIPLCNGERKRWLEARVNILLNRSRPVALAVG